MPVVADGRSVCDGTDRLLTRAIVLPEFDRAADFSRDYDGACLQMRMSYSPAAQFFLFLVQWTDCSLAGALGLLRILIYKVCFCGVVSGFDAMTWWFNFRCVLKESRLLCCAGLCGWEYHFVHT
jgi:hypothetical protein